MGNHFSSPSCSFHSQFTASLRSPMRKKWSQYKETIFWETIFPPPLAHFIRNSLPRCAPQCEKKWSQYKETIFWETIFPPPLAHFIRNSLPRCAPQCSPVIDLPVSGFNPLKSRNGITIYGAKPIYAPENLDSFASLTLYVRFAHSVRSLRSLSKFFTRLGAYARTANPIPLLDLL